MYEIGRRIKDIRELRNMKQKELADRLGIKNSTVSNWEQGLTRPNADTIVKICFILDVSADELLGIETKRMTVTPKERLLIQRYRDHPEMHPAMDAMLDLCNS